MKEQFLFHEKCDEDVQLILLGLKKNEGKSVKFKTELIASYQAIFENPDIGHTIFEIRELHIGTIRCLMLPSYSYGVLYRRFEGQKVVILGVVFVDFYYMHTKSLQK
jgi:hypothetical protein